MPPLPPLLTTKPTRRVRIKTAVCSIRDRLDASTREMVLAPPRGPLVAHTTLALAVEASAHSRSQARLARIKEIHGSRHPLGRGKIARSNRSRLILGSLLSSQSSSRAQIATRAQEDPPSAVKLLRLDQRISLLHSAAQPSQPTQFLALTSAHPDQLTSGLLPTIQRSVTLKSRRGSMESLKASLKLYKPSLCPSRLATWRS